jgi:NAD(P)-dependent dehydrogenase (short-subunit alcohol dehydrogenase family)
MEGKTVMVTGAGAGIGRETALALARQGAQVVLVARSEERARPTADYVAKLGGKAEVMAMDLGSLASIREGTQRFCDNHGKLDVLVNNAGVWAGSRTTTADNFETTWGVNVLAPFVLTHLLAAPLKAAGNPRVVNVVSVQHYKGDIHWDDLQLEKNYSPVRAYRQSKLALTMLTAEHAARETSWQLNAVHPGVAGTDLFRNFPAFIRFWINLLMSTPEKCSRPSVKLASHAAPSGAYFNQLKQATPHKLVADATARKRLWDVVAEHAGVQ